MKGILLLIWIFNLPGISQDEATTAGQREERPAETGPSIKISTHLVQVPVSVTDSSGKIATDLGIEDFRIGAIQNILLGIR